MKTSNSFAALAACLTTFIALPGAVYAGSAPALQVDPDTISPCIMWEDNANDLVCEDVRKYWGISPQEFSRWNPSVGLDCKPWRVQSYCVVPAEKLPPTTTTEDPETTTATATSSSSTTLRPSPTKWAALGCYVDDDAKYSALEKLVSKEGGDAELTISKCQNACYRAGFVFAGVKAGRECWCGDAVLGDLAEDESECNVVCAGDKSQKCGGTKRINVFEPTTSWDDEENGEGEDDEGEEKEEGEDKKAP